jgi:hypothetical protein
MSCTASCWVCRRWYLLLLDKYHQPTITCYFTNFYHCIESRAWYCGVIKQPSWNSTMNPWYSVSPSCCKSSHAGYPLFWRRCYKRKSFPPRGTHPNKSCCCMKLIPTWDCWTRWWTGTNGSCRRHRRRRILRLLLQQQQPQHQQVVQLGYNRSCK